MNISQPTILLFLILTLHGCSTVTGPTSEDYGKRTLGTVWDDQMIESRGKANIRAAHEQLKKAHINITAFNGMVLLTGQVASEELKNAAGDSIKDLRKVRKVHNELEVAGPTSMMARTNDSWLTTKVKAALLSSTDTEGSRIKVVTENGVAFLMGLLTRSEAEAAVEKTRKVFGVQKIVKVLEYIN
ncbi:MAG: osmotically-inducible protein OsmY [Candidatus Azotimanducaceae bacterium]|jgi:osmotically-inducible protein OsmY